MAILKKGNKGSSIKTLQKRLNEFNAKLTIDGDFGPVTEKAVRDFQKKSSLRVDGLVGKNTMAALDMKTTGGGSGGKKSSGGGGVSLVDWRLTDAKDRVKRFEKGYAAYPAKYKKHEKDHAEFMPRLNIHLAMSTGKDKFKALRKVSDLEAALESSYQALDRISSEFGGYLTQFASLVERYNSLSKSGKLADALVIGAEINRQNGLYKGMLHQWSGSLVEFDYANDTMINVRKALEKELKA